MDPLAMLRGDIEQMRLDPLTRARMIGERGDRIEEREAEARRAEARDRVESSRAHQVAIERMEIATQGHTSRELEDHKREREAQRAEQVAEAWATIERLDPRVAAQKRAEVARMSQVAEMETTLARARAVRDDPFMRQEIRRFHERGAYGREISR
jgi:hypothetical protein